MPKDSLVPPTFAELVSSQGPTTISSKLRNAKHAYSQIKDRLGLGHHEEEDNASTQKSRLGHAKVPSISTHPAPEDLIDLETAIDMTNISDSSLEPTRSARSSRHSSQSSFRADKYEPRVLHGWTLTPDVGFRAVCKAIKRTAFEKSDLPIIVSLEVHADLDQQQVMVDIMQEEWKGYLVDQAHPTCDPNERQPRLEELRHKILVKVKKATQPPMLKNGVPVTGPQQDANVVASVATKSQTSLTPTTSTPTALTPRTASDDRDSGVSDSDDNRAPSSKKKKPKKNAICENLSRLGIYTHSEHFSDFHAPAASHPPHIFSIAEGDILDLHNDKRAEMFTHNRRYFMRAYPSGRRIDSSNPDPSVFWRKGVQMVALNWQHWDEGTMINEGMFGGGRGWVLKPPGFLDDAHPVTRQTLDFRITILAGQQIPLPPDVKKEKDFHPYVKCELHVDKYENNDGLPNMAKVSGPWIAGTYKVCTNVSKGVEPDWGSGATIKYENIPNVVEQLSFLR